MKQYSIRQNLVAFGGPAAGRGRTELQEKKARRVSGIRPLFRENASMGGGTISEEKFFFHFFSKF